MKALEKTPLTINWTQKTMYHGDEIEPNYYTVKFNNMIYNYLPDHKYLVSVYHHIPNEPVVIAKFKYDTIKLAEEHILKTILINIP